MKVDLAPSAFSLNVLKHLTLEERREINFSAPQIKLAVGAKKKGA